MEFIRWMYRFIIFLTEALQSLLSVLHIRGMNRSTHDNRKFIPADTVAFFLTKSLFYDLCGGLDMSVAFIMSAVVIDTF